MIPLLRSGATARGHQDVNTIHLDRCLTIIFMHVIRVLFLLQKKVKEHEDELHVLRGEVNASRGQHKGLIIIILSDFVTLIIAE